MTSDRRDPQEIASRLSAVEPLRPEHKLESFDCGTPELVDWLVRFALDNHQRGFTRTHVVHDGFEVVGFYALAMSAVAKERSPTRIRRRGPREVPVVLLARLGVDVRYQGVGLGAALLKDAILRSARAAEQIAARALLAHAKDDRAKGFYKRFDFEESPTDPLHVFLRLPLV